MCAVLAAAVPAADADDAKSLGHRSMFSQLMKTGNETETKRKKNIWKNKQEHSQSVSAEAAICIV